MYRIERDRTSERLASPSSATNNIDNNENQLRSSSRLWLSTSSVNNKNNLLHEIGKKLVIRVCNC